MKKHLIAIAVAAAVAAPAAMADTTLYGLAHASIDYISVDREAGDESNIGVSSNSSRLGVKGSEKLAAGLTAVYQFETQLDISSNEGASNYLFTSARNTFVGLNGGFGTVLVGKHDTPMKMVGRSYDLFGDQVGDSRNIIGAKDGAADVTEGLTGFDLRPNNVIAYVSPSMGGFQAIAAYVTDHDFEDKFDNTGDNKFDLNDFDAYSISLGYKAKMFDVAAAYEAHNISDELATTVARDLGVPASAVSDSETAYRIGAGVNFGGARINALYQQTSDAGFVSGYERASYGLGASYTFGKNVVKAQYFVADDLDTDAGSVKDSGASLVAVGYDYKMSKQTTLYAAYALASNDNGTDAFTATGFGHGDDPSVDKLGGDSSAFSVGVKHKF